MTTCRLLIEYIFILNIFSSFFRCSPAAGESGGAFDRCAIIEGVVPEFQFIYLIIVFRFVFNCILPSLCLGCTFALFYLFIVL